MATMAAHNTPTTDDNGRRSNGDSSSSSVGGSVTAAAAKPASEMPSRNPLPLSASQEAQVREVFNKRVRDQCADEIKGE